MTVQIINRPITAETYGRMMSTRGVATIRRRDVFETLEARNGQIKLFYEERYQKIMRLQRIGGLVAIVSLVALALFFAFKMMINSSIGAPVVYGLDSIESIAYYSLIGSVLVGGVIAYIVGACRERMYMAKPLDTEQIGQLLEGIRGRVRAVYQIIGSSAQAFDSPDSPVMYPRSLDDSGRPKSSSRSPNGSPQFAHVHRRMDNMVQRMQSGHEEQRMPVDHDLEEVLEVPAANDDGTVPVQQNEQEEARSPSVLSVESDEAESYDARGAEVVETGNGGIGGSGFLHLPSTRTGRGYVHVGGDVPIGGQGYTVVQQHGVGAPPSYYFHPMQQEQFLSYHQGREDALMRVIHGGAWSSTGPLALMPPRAPQQRSVPAYTPSSTSPHATTTTTTTSASATFENVTHSQADLAQQQQQPQQPPSRQLSPQH